MKRATRLNREPIPLSELILGTECGGSDYTSGFASNPAVGHACDMLVAEGGTVILSETPELIGAEHLLARRARTPEMAKELLDAVPGGSKRRLQEGRISARAIHPPGILPEALQPLRRNPSGAFTKQGQVRWRRL